MVNRIVEEAHDAVALQSSDSTGATFLVALPLGDTSTEAIVPSDMPTDRRILLLEDEPQVRTTLSSILQSAGYHATEAINVKESLSVPLDNIDLVLSDAVLPDGNPKALIEESHVEAVPVIVCSGYMRDDVLDQEVSGFLQNPVSRKTMLETIAQVLENSLSSASGSSTACSELASRFISRFTKTCSAISCRANTSNCVWCSAGPVNLRLL